MLSVVMFEQITSQLGIAAKQEVTAASDRNEKTSDKLGASDFLL
jgi:hypothetical protein